jgi:Uma2 family endonuclease
MVEAVAKKITVQAFQEMDFADDDPFIYELIDGVLMKRQIHKPLQQRVSGLITAAFDTFLKGNPIGQAFYGPIDVFFDQHNNTQPDILFIQKDRSFIIDLENGIMGAPDLIVEIISPSSIKMDRFDKRELHKKFAVKEYWVIDPKNQTVEIHVFQKDDYVLHQFLEIEGVVDSTIMKGLDLEIKNLFA